ncbi:hypothetical protein [Microcystis phage Mel-JY01]
MTRFDNIYKIICSIPVALNTFGVTYFIYDMNKSDIKTKCLLPFYRETPYILDGKITKKYFNINVHTDCEVSSFIDAAHTWCVNTFGYNTQYETPPGIYWVWRSCEMEMPNALGMFSSVENSIEIRIRGHRNYLNLVDTIIHEYIHHLQPAHGGWHTRYNNMYGYFDSPYEREARYYAYTHAPLCLNNLNASTCL